jgi:hypothetical protein
MRRRRKKQKRGIFRLLAPWLVTAFAAWCIQGSVRRMRKDRGEEVEENGEAGASGGTQ